MSSGSWPAAIHALLQDPDLFLHRLELLQQHVAPERIGRTFALVHLTVTGMTALSALVAGEAAVSPTTLRR